MEITETKLPGVLVMRPTPHRDDRGLFTRTFEARAAAEYGVVLGPDSQDSQSRSLPGVLRGMHGRIGVGESKLVRCSYGKVLDMIVDGRPDSPTFGQHLAIELDDDAFVAVWIPAGCLHGFQVLSDTPADICYRIDTPHDPDADISVRWDDPELALPWRDSSVGPWRDSSVGPGQHLIISDRDRQAGSWADYVRTLASHR